MICTKLSVFQQKDTDILVDNKSTLHRDVICCFPAAALETRCTPEQEESSRRLRDQGNKMYQVSWTFCQSVSGLLQTKRFPEALSLYTRAALAAGPGREGLSKEMALAMWNRCCIFFTCICTSFCSGVLFTSSRGSGPGVNKTWRQPFSMVTLRRCSIGALLEYLVYLGC